MKKICSKCKDEKDVDDFYKSSQKLDGLQVQCKACIRFANRKEQRVLRVKRMNRGTWDCPDKVVTPKEEAMKPQVKERFLLNAFCILLTIFIASCGIESPLDVAYTLPDYCGHSVTYNEELKRIEVKVVSSNQYATICYKRPGHEAFCKVSERTYFNCISLTATNVEGVEVQIDEECIYTL